jgi:hypothetical protein
VQIALQPPPLGVGRRDHARDRDRGRHRGGAAVLSDDPGPLAAGLGDPLAASLGEHQHPAQDEQRTQDGNRAGALAEDDHAEGGGRERLRQREGRDRRRGQLLEPLGEQDVRECGGDEPEVERERGAFWRGQPGSVTERQDRCKQPTP